MEIILDTNFILAMIEKKIDLDEAFKELFGVYVLIVGEQVIEELEKISENSENKTVYRENARLAIKILKNNKNVKIVSFNKKYVDAGIVNYLKFEDKNCVATLDRELKRKIREKFEGVKILGIRGKKVFV